MTTTNHPAGDRHWTRRMPDRVPRGADAPGARLTAAERQTIRAFIGSNPGANISWLAREYGVSRMTIWRLVRDLRV